jgi:hypothetical protein
MSGMQESILLFVIPETIASEQAIGRPTLITSMGIYSGTLTTQAKKNRESSFFLF